MNYIGCTNYSALAKIQFSLFGLVDLDLRKDLNKIDLESVLFQIPCLAVNYHKMSRIYS